MHNNVICNKFQPAKLRLLKHFLWALCNSQNVILHIIIFKTKLTKIPSSMENFKRKVPYEMGKPRA